MTTKTINKYRNKSLSQLKKLATTHFNRFIRKRDEGKGCVSCPSHKVEHASHFYSGGSYPALKFNENNVHGSCIHCNKYLHGNLNEYRKRIIKRITEEELIELDNLAAHYKRTSFKWDKMALIEIIEKYKKL